MLISKGKIIATTSLFIKLLLISILGITLLYKFTSFLSKDISKDFLPIVIPSVIVIIFIIVCLIVSEVFKFVNYGIVGTIKNYNSRTIFFILFKCFIIILSGFTLAVLYNIEFSGKKEFGTSDLLFYISDILLIVYSLIGVIKGEQLRELNYRKLETENQLLKSKINPHFLYNTLNNIDSLIWLNQDKASDSIIRLSSLMRYMTYQTQKPYVLLCDELLHLTDYIELQKLRYDNPKAISFNKEIYNEKEIYISPMILIPFVENSFKHCSDKNADDSIIISIYANRSELIFSVDNCYKEDLEIKKDGGFGLNGVEKRLKLIYNKQYDLSISKNENRFKVNLRIRFDSDAAL